MKKSRTRAAVLAVVITIACVAPPIATTGTAGADPVGIDAHGSVEQVYATGLPPGNHLELLDDGGDTVATTQVNTLGAALFRNVEPGSGYTVSDLDAHTTSAPLTVHPDDPAPWNPDIYDQPIAQDGYQYLTTRDGTQLALDVHLPLAGGPGPYPTLIEYAGYGYADPAGPQSGLAMLANAMGFAVVDVNMRGTGCSGGAFDYFETLQNLDAYDVIETVANQPWVLHNQVGMFGISYGGISQLFAAQLDPPHLAAIAPLSVIDATPTTLYPGGILNSGFALSWAQGRVDDAQPATADTGQKWAYKRIQEGDTVCEANQALHLEAVDLIAKIADNRHYVPEVVDPLDPVSFVHKIRVPTYLACQFQDEQTGGHCPELVRHFTGTDDKWFSFTNGAHIDSLDPENLNQVFDFLQLFVAERPPGPDSGLMRLAAPLIYRSAMGVSDDVTYNLPDDPVQHETTYAGALAAFRNLPTVQVRFDNGAGTDPKGAFIAGNPYAAYTTGFDSLPVAGTQTRTWYLGPDGTLTDDPPSDYAADTYTSDASALPPTDYDGDTGGGGLWANADAWKWNWVPNPDGSAVSYLTPPLAHDTTVVGTGAVTVWVRSSTPDVDLQATISEVRPDGVESFVQNGWLRASARTLSTDANNIFKRPSTPADPIPSFAADDAAPMPAGEFVPVAIPLYYQGHAYRAGSKIRVVVSAPNGSQPIWSFDETQPAGATSQVAIARTPSMPSSLKLPVVPDVEIPTALPACPSLRNEPCRTYTASTNASEALTPPTTSSTTSVPDTTNPATSAPVTSGPGSTLVVDIGANTTTPPAAGGHDTSATTTASGRLPATGAAVWVLLTIGACLVVLGAALSRATRRRRPATSR